MRDRWAKRLHRTADRVDVAFRPMLGRAPALEAAWIRALDRIVAAQADRRYLRKTILPAIRGAAPERVLFVGVRGYTRRYGATFRGAATEYWTSDIDPAAAAYGAPGRHVVGDLCELDRLFAPEGFQIVMVNGVFGWGLDEPGRMERAIRAVHSVLASRGVLLLGWNSDRVTDPEELPALQELFAPAVFAGLPQRRAFADVTHVYGWYRKRD